MSDDIKKESENALRKLQEFPVNVARTIRDAVAGIAGTISGKNVEDRIGEYTEIYGEILVGLFEDMEEMKKILNAATETYGNLDESVVQLSQRIEAFIAEGNTLKKMRRGILINRLLILTALALSGLAVWQLFSPVKI